MAELNFFDSYMMMAIVEEIVPPTSFFRDRYFPTGEEDIFSSNKVLVEYQKGDRKIAPFVAPRVGDVPIGRGGYEISEYQPPYIGISRTMTIDDLQERGFGEAIYPGSDPAQRAARLQLKDFTDLDRRIAGREEWMASQTMINNACAIQEYIDDKTLGEKLCIRFYGDASEHTYTPANPWNSSNGNFFGDVKAMCKLLARRGLRAADLILGSQAADAVEEIQEVRDRLNKTSGIITGEIKETIFYPGVVRMGKLNFGGFELTLFDVSESYENENGVDTPYFPATSAMVTYPGCGRMAYAQVTQIPYGSPNHESIAAKRVPKLIIDQEHDIRKLRLGARPLAIPRNYCPYIYAANVVE